MRFRGFAWAGALTGCCALGLLVGPAAGLGSSPGPPSNDNYNFATNLNARGQPLTRIHTLQSKVDTSNASLQPNLLSPCGQGQLLCPKGPPELNTCNGVSYGKTVWYDFYPDHDGQVEIRTNGIPNVIRLYRYDPTTLVPTPIWCATGSKYTSNELEDNVNGGDAYSFQIGGRGTAGGKLQVQFNYAYKNLAVAPFFIRPTVYVSTAEPNQAKLLRIKLIGFARSEGVSYACANCGGGLLQHGVRRGNTIILSSKSAPILSSQTLMIITATAPAQIGRFKVYGFRPHLGRLPVLASGCLAPQQTTVTPPEAKHVSLLQRISCPAPAVNPIGAEYVFWRNRYGRLWESRYSGRNWTAPERLTVGRPSSVPAVAVHANGEQDVFWKGGNGHLWEAWYHGKWHHASDFGSGTLASPPAAGVDSAGDEYVFWKGQNGGLWGRSYRDGGWTPSFEVNIAGELGSGPAVAVHPGGEVDAFWKGLNGRLTEVWCSDRCGDGGQWHGPLMLGGGTLGSTPAVAADAAGNQYVFWEGTDRDLWGQAYVAGNWEPAMPLNGGLLGSPPTVAVHADGQQDVFWRGRDGRLWETWGTAGHWAGPRSLPARLDSQPVAGLDASGKKAG